jgi:hypothetical protein
VGECRRVTLQRSTPGQMNRAGRESLAVASDITTRDDLLLGEIPGRSIADGSPGHGRPALRCRTGLGPLQGVSPEARQIVVGDR